MNKNSISRLLVMFMGAIFLSMGFASFTATYFQTESVNPVTVLATAFTVRFALYFLPQPKGVFGDDSLSLSELSSNLKDYLLENFTQLYYKVLNASLPDYMTPIYGIKDELPLVELSVSDILQPGGKDTFNPKPSVQFKDRIGKVRPMKTDVEFTHKKIMAMYKSYLGQVKAGRIDPTTMPFEADIMNRIVVAIKNDVRMKAIFKGVWNADGTSPVDTVNGYLKIISDAIVATDLPSDNIYAGSALSNTNAYDQITALVDKVYANENYSSVPMVALIAPSRKRWYEQDYAATRGAAPYNTSFNQDMIEGTNIKFIAEPGLEGKDRIIITPQENLLFLADDPTGMESLDVDYQKRTRSIAVLSDFQMAPEFAILEQVWVNNYSGI